MASILKPLDLIAEADLRDLVENKVREVKTIEYKQQLPGNSDGDKREFLYDVSSFANASGGDIIYGMREAGGVAAEVIGLQIEDVDKEVLRLEGMIRTSIEERIPGLAIRTVPLITDGVAVIIRIPRSFALPHMVKFGGLQRFYSRNSAGKYPLDIRELRTLFDLSATTAERIRKFRAERLATIIANEGPVLMDSNSKIVLHVVPLGAFDPAARLDLSRSVIDQANLCPMRTAGSWNSSRHNFDGLFTTASDNNISYSYVQIFSSGSIEAVNTSLLHSPWQKDPPMIPSLAYEEELIDALSRFLAIQKQLGIELPVFVMLSVLGVKGFRMGYDKQRFFDEGRTIDRDALIVPEVLLESYDAKPVDVLRPLFDAVWNAAGWSRSMNYDDKGNWVGR